MTADHTIRLRLDRGWSKLYLHCEHGKELPWHGDYDEFGTLLDDEVQDECWAAEWADADGADVSDYLELDGQLDDVRLPFPVHAWFDGDGLRLDPAPEPTPDLMYPYAIAGAGWVQRIRVTSPFFAEHPDVGFGDTLTYRGEEVTVVPYGPPGGVLVDDAAPGQPPAAVNQRLNGRVS